MKTQLTFGLMSGESKTEPYAAGDVLVTHSGKRVCVTLVDDNIHGAVFVGVDVANGVECIVLEREVAYRSR